MERIQRILMHINKKDLYLFNGANVSLSLTVVIDFDLMHVSCS